MPACFLKIHRKGMYMDSKGDGENFIGVGEGEIVTRIYSMKKIIFNKKIGENIKSIFSLQIFSKKYIEGI